MHQYHHNQMLMYLNSSTQLQYHRLNHYLHRQHRQQPNHFHQDKQLYLYKLQQAQYCPESGYHQKEYQKEPDLPVHSTNSNYPQNQLLQPTHFVLQDRIPFYQVPQPQSHQQPMHLNKFQTDLQTQGFAHPGNLQHQ